MSLSRQLAILLGLLLGLLFLGSVALSLGNARDYLRAQLASHAQDAATSLGLAATAHVENGDRATVTAMVNAMFHRGDYLQIRFEDLDGQAWIERAAPLLVEDVPAWFVRVVPLEPPQGTASVMSGWRQAGRVLVRSHPGLAYRQLWEGARETLVLFLAGALAVWLVGLIGLRLLLRPLARIERQAAAICRREFPQFEGRPFTLEFRRVTDAMNQLSQRVGRMLDEAEQSALRLRAQALQDPLTGLANRRHLMAVMQQHLDDRERCAGGGLLLLQLEGLQALNRRRGYAAGDRLLQAAAAAIGGCIERLPEALAARLSGAGFAVLVGRVDEAGLHELAARLSASLAGLQRTCGLDSADVAHVGGALCRGQTPEALLSTADLALRTAQRQGANAWSVQALDAGSGPTRTAAAWRQLIEQALRAGRFSLLRQPVLAADRGLLHHELFLRLVDPDRPGVEIAAETLVPMAERGGLAAVLDRCVLGAVLDGVEDGDLAGPVAVNLNPASLRDAELLAWLAGRLEHLPPAPARLALELPEYGIAADPANLAGWIARLAPMGVVFGLDHFGRGFSDLGYLRSLRLGYIKVDGSLVRDVAQRAEGRLLLRALVDIGHGLDMRVLGEAVEAEADWAALLELGADGGRGFWLGAPERAWPAN